MRIAQTEKLQTRGPTGEVMASQIHPPTPQFQLPAPTRTSGGGRLGEEALGVPRFHKLEFLTYGGDEDPLPWLNQCEQFFRGQRTMEEEKV